MAVRLADAIAFLSADTKGLKSDLAGAESDVQGSGGAMSGILTGVAQGIGQGVLGLVTGALGSVKQFIGDSISSASDLNEVTNKTNVVFGDQAAAIQKWAANSATALGQSKAEALGALGTFGNLFVAMGLSTDKSAGMSEGLVQLASDLASFNNISPTEALDKLRAGISGETEPLKTLGVNINQTQIAAKALQLGLVQTTVDMTKVNGATLGLEQAQAKAAAALKKHGQSSLEYRLAAQGVAEAQGRLDDAMAGSTVQLTAAQKAQASYALIMEQTKTAQGDFANTSTGLANSQRIAAAQWENLKATLGTALLPVVGQLMILLNQLLQSVMPPLANFIQGTIAPAMEQFAHAMSFAGSIMSELIGLFITLDYTADKGADSIDLALKALGVAPAVIGKVDDILDQITNRFYEFIFGWENGFDLFRESAEKDGLGPLIYLKTWFDQNMPRIQQIVSQVLTAIQSFWAEHGATIMHIVNNYLTIAMNIFDTAFKTILDIITFFLQLWTGDFKGAGETLAGIVERIWKLVGTVFSTALDSIKTLITGIDWAGLGFDIVQGIANGIMGAVTVITTAARRVAKDAFDSAKSFLGIHSPSKLTEEEIGRPFGEGIGIGARKALGNVAAGVSGGLQGLMDNVQMPALQLAGAPGGAMGNISVNLNFYGQADPKQVKQAATDGVLTALRAVGVR